MTSSNFEYDDATGTIVPDTSNIRSEVSAQFQSPSVFGPSLVVTSDTTQGKIIDILTLLYSQSIANSAATANAFNPNLAIGVQLDAIGALMGIFRDSGTFSTAILQLSGQAATIIPIGTQIESTNNDIFLTASTVTIDSNGSATVTGIAQLAGPVPVLINTINIIPSASQIPGWATVTNPAAGVAGNAIQTDEEFRVKRNKTLGLMSKNSIFSMTAALNNFPTILSSKTIENSENVDQTYPGITVLAKTTWSCVIGSATDEGVAQILYNTKGPGSGFTGSIEVPILDTANDITYIIKFDRAVAVPMLIKVTIKNSASVADPVTAITNAILNYVAGGAPNYAGWGVGTEVVPFVIAGAVTCQVPFLDLVSLECAYSSDGIYTSAILPIDENQIPVVSAAGINVQILS